MQRRHKVIFFLMLVSPVLMGGYGNDNGCGCGDDWSSSDPVVDPPQMVEESKEVSSECLVHIDDALRMARPTCPPSSDQTCVIDDAGLADLKQQLASTKAELAQLKARKATKPGTSKTRVLKTVRVKRNWWVGRYVKATPGANLQATRECNGFTSRNPTVKVGQSLKICGW